MAQATTRGGLLGALMLTNRQLKIAAAAAAAIAVVVFFSFIAGGLAGFATMLGTVIGTVLLVWVSILMVRVVRYRVSRIRS